MNTRDRPPTKPMTAVDESLHGRLGCVGLGWTVIGSRKEGRSEGVSAL